MPQLSDEPETNTNNECGKKSDSDHLEPTIPSTPQDSDGNKGCASEEGDFLEPLCSETSYLVGNQCGIGDPQGIALDCAYCGALTQACAGPPSQEYLLLQKLFQIDQIVLRQLDAAAGYEQIANIQEQVILSLPSGADVPVHILQRACRLMMQASIYEGLRCIPDLADIASSIDEKSERCRSQARALLE